MNIDEHRGLGRTHETLAAQGRGTFLCDVSNVTELPFKQRVAGSSPARLISVCRSQGAGIGRAASVPMNLAEGYGRGGRELSASWSVAKSPLGMHHPLRVGRSRTETPRVFIIPFGRIYIPDLDEGQDDRKTVVPNNNRWSCLLDFGAARRIEFDNVDLATANRRSLSSLRHTPSASGSQSAATWRSRSARRMARSLRSRRHSRRSRADRCTSCSM